MYCTETKIVRGKGVDFKEILSSGLIRGINSEGMSGAKLHVLFLSVVFFLSVV